MAQYELGPSPHDFLLDPDIAQSLGASTDTRCVFSVATVCG
jgi:hypothetical protein